MVKTAALRCAQCVSFRRTGRRRSVSLGPTPADRQVLSRCPPDLFEDSRRAPVSRLAPGYSVYRRPRMAEEGVPANAELV